MPVDQPSTSAFDEFCSRHAAWLDDFALFMALKDAHDHVAWTRWEADIAARQPAAVARWSSTPGARDSTPQADAVSLLRSVGARPRALPRAIDRHSGRSANLRGTRQRRRLVATRSLSSRPHGTADGRGGRTTRLLQCHRPALGQSALRLEAPRANRLRVVDRSGSHDADARRSRTTRSFSRVCRIVGSSRRRHDCHSRRMEARTRCSACSRRFKPH